MERFSIFWRYSCSTPSKLHHQRTIRFTLVRSIPQTFFFSCSLIRFLNLFLDLWHWTFFPLLFITDFSDLYTFFIVPSPSIRMSLDTFLTCFFKTFAVAFHYSFDWRMEWQWRVGQCWWLHLALDFTATPRKSYRGRSRLPPNREHYYSRLKVVFDVQSYEVIIDGSSIEQPM